MEAFVAYCHDLDLLSSPKDKCLIATTATISALCGSFFLWKKLKNNKKLDIHMDGVVSPGFEKVADAFRKNLETGWEKGGNFSAYYNGNLVVDLWGGFADEESLKLRREDSTSLAFSATKGVVAICMAHLVERGYLDYKKTVATYWSEFAQNGKENITVEMLLSHQVDGLYFISGGFDFSMIMDDNEKLERLLAEQKPMWKPGTKHGYHAMTFGLYCDQLVRRVDPKRRTLWEYYEEEIAIPFDIEFTMQEKLENFYKACRHGRANFGWGFTLFRTLPVMLGYCFTLLWYYIQNGKIYMRNLFGNVRDLDYKRFNDPYIRNIPCGSSSGVGTARGLAKLYGILANQGLLPDSSNDLLTFSKDQLSDVEIAENFVVNLHRPQDGSSGKILLKPETINLLSEQLTEERDHVIVAKLPFGRGMMVDFNYRNKKRLVFGHMGAGCQVGLCDPKLKIGWAYLTNYANPFYGLDNVEMRYDPLEKALYECVENIKDYKIM
ncbi:hypothetical protein HELRODRAFT_154931 [Helobdella robusta]|uniref:Beta-lactamase-related domain-containing protein n=1 Tax=Helobdella robusta TaxID=6412 RepID=T1ELG4_HELRO|nr:hypothetical protein HELRODRAFT_154931 [Helobdella robusta]ESO00886.1 hypothetical protein HELRODRAFT_154931 [Helobdella robusta]